MRFNGSIIGVDNTPTVSLASGVWSWDELIAARLNSTWPRVQLIEFVGSHTGVSIGAGQRPATISINGTLTGGIGSSPIQDDYVIASITTPSSSDQTMGVTTSGFGELSEPAPSAVGSSPRLANLMVCSKFMTGSPDTSIVFSSGVADTLPIIMNVNVFRGVDASSPMDVALTTATGGSTYLANPPSITPSSVGAVILAIGAAGIRDNPTGDFTQAAGQLSGFRSTNAAVTASGSDYAGILASGYYPWTSGAFDPTAFTGGAGPTGNSNWGAVTLALRPA